VLHLLAAAFALFMLARHGGRALAFIAPSLVRVAPEGGGARTLAQVRAGEALAALGFRHVGAYRERGPLGAFAARRDAWASPDGGTYADVDAGGRGGEADVTFVSPFGDGAFVVTSNHPRVALSGPLVQAGGLAGASVEAALAAHRVAVQRFAATHGAPEAFATLPARVLAAGRFRAGPGRAEVRRHAAMSFANACVAVVLLVGSVNLAARALK
jgi:hypothetical protein